MVEKRIPPGCRWGDVYLTERWEGEFNCGKNSLCALSGYCRNLDCCVGFVEKRISLDDKPVPGLPAYQH